MKKSFVVLLLNLLILIGMSPAAYSQIGLRGGINLSTFVGEDVSETKDLMGLHAGLSFSIINIGPVSLVPEIYYAEKGTRFTEQLWEIQNPDPNNYDLDPDYELEFNLAYVEIPVLAKVRLPFLSTKVVHPYIAGGPVFGFRLDCSISFTGTTTEQEIQDCADENFSDLETAFKESDRGYVLVSGIDFQIPLLGTLTLDARYYRGLSRLIENGENDDVYNQNITLMLGYTLPF
ncbi:porin family protein [Rhodohalobacter sp. 614A]|uniref:porin family protein n=1 Tax=Rhodohalobacter sp. 614A TaxID=2908649 RepID=UPI001F463ACF|nr:porin family protein [Rhodohalobacter sp. 614A]